MTKKGKTTYCATFLAAVISILLCAVSAHAAGKSTMTAPGSTEIAVYARYVDNTEFTVIPTGEDGSGSAVLPDGTKVSVSGANAAKGKLIVEEVADENVLAWIAEKIGSKASDAKVYYIHYLFEDGTSQPANGVTVTIKLRGSSDFYSVYAVNGSETGKLPSTSARNGAVTFTVNGSPYYAVYKDPTAAPDGRSPQTGDCSNMALWGALLLVSGSAVMVIRRRKQART